MHIDILFVLADLQPDAAPKKKRKVKRKVAVKAETGSASLADTVDQRLNAIPTDVLPAEQQALSEVAIKQELTNGENAQPRTQHR